MSHNGNGKSRDSFNGSGNKAKERKAMIGPSLSDVLRHHYEEQHITVDNTAAAFITSEQTVYAMLEGRWDNRLDQFRHALRTLPDCVADGIVSALLAGTTYRMPVRGDGCVDINGDGRKDTRDPVDGMIAMLERASVALKEARAAEGSRLYTGEKSAQLMALVNEIGSELDDVRSLIPALTARPLAGVGR